MNPFREREGRLIWQEDRHILELQGWGRDAVRVRATMNGDFFDVPGALVEESVTKAAVEIKESEAVISNGRMVARITNYGRIRFFKSGAAESGGSKTGSETLLLEEEDWRAEHIVLYPLGREFKSLDSDLFRIQARFKAQEGERFYGLGQHRHGLLNQKGAVIELFQRNAEVSIPFLVSSRGYGFLWNNPAIGRVELGRNGTRWVADATRQLDYVVVTGESYGDIMGRYADITGHAPMIPKWATGFWQCKLRYMTQNELLSIAREYKKREIPLSVIVVDFFHWTRQGEWRWDPKCWPDPQAMIRELDEMGVKLMVSIWPTVNPKSEFAAQMRARGMLIGTNHGLNVIFPFIDTNEERPVFVHYYDSTNPEARAFVWERVKESYFDKGVKVFWLDACEPEINPLEHENLRYHLGTGAEVGNIYPMMHERGFYEGMRAAGQKEVLNLCRSGWAGSQRYGAAIWSGDIPSTWESLRAQIRAGLNIMMSGIPWWTTDIGGFWGGNIEDPDFLELIVRWFQYGVFCPLFRLHGNRLPKKEGIGLSGADNEIWSFGEESYRIIREIVLMRERMRPYIMEQMKLASEKGIPPMRPLFFDFPEDGECYNVEDEFLLGPDILVAPVAERAARSRKVYLPGGASWRDAWTGQLKETGQWFEAETPLEQIPVYVREGSSIRLTAD
jgi:alpha-D-xyloside xylohydrolase